MENKIKIETYENGEESYKLLDSGDKLKLEKIGPYVIIRSEPRAWWRKDLPESEWQKAVAIYDKENAKEWKFKSKVNENVEAEFSKLKIILKFSKRSKQIGVFPEQSEQWQWIEEKIKNSGDINILNLFGYTGLSSLIAARAGARVTHVDGSKAAIEWARENQKFSGLEDKPIRWILDDTASFIKREFKRGVKYDAIIMDPPSFGRGPKGEVWKIEENLPELLKLCKEVMSENFVFMILNLYSTELSSISLANLLSDATSGGKIENGEMAIKHLDSDKLLPMSIFARSSK